MMYFTKNILFITRLYLVSSHMTHTQIDDGYTNLTKNCFSAINYY